MSKVILLIAAASMAACEAYPGRTTNCWGANKLMLSPQEVPAGGCDDWVSISE